MSKKRPIVILLWLAVTVSIFVWTMVSYQAQVDPQLKDEILIRHGLVMLFPPIPIFGRNTTVTEAICYDP